MADSPDLSLIGRCGMYCGACAVYLAGREGGELRRKMAKKLGIPEEKVGCEGCGRLLSTRNIKICDILRCLESSGRSFCFECESYHQENCEHFEKIFSSHIEKDGLNLRVNLKKLENSTPERWLEENSRKWVCQSCGSRVTIGATKCHRCEKPFS